MTDRSRGIPVAAIAGGVFCLVLISLALQVRAGKDPAIGAGQQSAAAQPARQVIVRRIIVRRIVDEDASDSSLRGRATNDAAASGAQPAASASAAAPAAPAPAPTPAPVVSRAS